MCVCVIGVNSLQRIFVIVRPVIFMLSAGTECVRVLLHANSSCMGGGIFPRHLSTSEGLLSLRSRHGGCLYIGII